MLEKYSETHLCMWKAYGKHLVKNGIDAGGQTSIKKLLMWYITRSDFDLMHYKGQSTEDLKQIYEKVMGDYRIIL